MSSLEPTSNACVGPQSEQAGKASSCAGCPNQSVCASGEAKVDNSLQYVQSRLSGVKHKVLILSGKGGVGKSTFSAQLAFALAQQGKQVGLLDIDICGPSIPRMLGLEGHEVHQSASGWSPVFVDDNLAVMSIGFMLPAKDDAIIWRGPRKNGLIKQFLTDVNWPDLDYLLIDTPPGTSDEHISIVQLLKASGIRGAVVVTTPQEVSMADVRKELNFCRKTGVPILGLVENMSDIRVPFSSLSDPNAGVRLVSKEGEDRTAELLQKIQAAVPELLDVFIESHLFKLSDNKGADNACTAETANNPRTMAQRFNVPYLGALPMDRNVMRACEEGQGFLEHYRDSTAAEPFAHIVQELERIVEQRAKEEDAAAALSSIGTATA